MKIIAYLMCDWCTKPRNVRPRVGGCPCPKTGQEADERTRQARRRHEASVALAEETIDRHSPTTWITAPLSPNLPPTAAGVWLKRRDVTSAHLFAPEAGKSACGKVSRTLSWRPARRRVRQCKFCLQHESRQR